MRYRIWAFWRYVEENIKILLATLLGENAVFRAFSLDSRGSQANYYVAAGGRDANPGMLARPFATLSKAQQAARKGWGANR
jgi:hypothetical protein